MVTYRAGIDIGSTTVKLVILDSNDEMVFSDYCRHHARVQDTLRDLLSDAREKLGDFDIKAKITGSGSINLGKAIGIDFIQEVVAVAKALKHVAPQTDVAIELGGEDAKIIYFTGGLEERMNGVCAGGTGSFIDQMASLLQTDATGLNEYAKDYKLIHPIAARCGVFAKTDIQPLINEGATKPDLSASIFQSVVNQTISGLACGKPIRGCVAFLGGPLHFLSELKKAFIRTLELTPENIVDPENSHLFAAMGAALNAEDTTSVDISVVLERLENKLNVIFEMPRLDPLFTSEKEYEEFCDRHETATVPKAEISEYNGKAFLGIDAGSTTTKLTLIGAAGEILFSFYSNNNGNPIATVQRAFEQLRGRMHDGIEIARTCSTGYGESLLKAAFSLDEGVVETIAHSTAASFFDPEVDSVLDIGGQDMKFIKLKNGIVDNILLNEACSSGCGSFIENFASSLGYNVVDFAKVALFAESPVDLGTRCTVFMNSNVKQAQKENVPVADISAGLAYSVIKNALYKVIKLSNPDDLGKHIVVQGGTFHNHAVLRAFEKISGVDVTCPDISGLMGAFGAALVARKNYDGTPTAMVTLDEAKDLEYTTRNVRCKGCNNHCMLTINIFAGSRKYVSGNRCEKGADNHDSKEKAPNMVDFKQKVLFDFPVLSEAEATRGVIGLPRVLNMYENYPFWATFFKELGFRTVISPFSDRSIYELGMESIPSESECYPAKLAHGHVQWLIDQGIKDIFHPCVFYEYRETDAAQNKYNCPIVVSYAENIKNNTEDITLKDINYHRPFISFFNEDVATKRLVRFVKDVWGISEDEAKRASHAAWVAQRSTKDAIREEGRRLLKEMEERGRKGIVLAGRPYHIDPEINHGIPDLIASYGLYVFTEDSLPLDQQPTRPVRVVDQWVFHSRLYTAAEFVTKRRDLELLQLNSFGCGLDAVTTDQVSEILEQSGKLYTVLKIDEVNNLGAVRIRIRSLLAAMETIDDRSDRSSYEMRPFERTEFTSKMKDEGYTLICPQMSPIHFEFIQPIMKRYGYNFVVLDNDGRRAIDTGLKFVNNDACYPSIISIGQIMDAVLSGEYDTDRLAIVMSQTGGCCRASNYVAFIRRALTKVNLSHIPVISMNFNGMEKNEGFSLSKNMIIDATQVVVYADLLMRCLYRVRPYELVPGSANELHAKWRDRCLEILLSGHGLRRFRRTCREIVKDFDELPIHEDMVKPKVGIVGEILVKYMPLANNYLVDLLEREGAEAVVPNLIDFFSYGVYSKRYNGEYLDFDKKMIRKSVWGTRLIRFIQRPAMTALAKSKRFSVPMHIEEIGEHTKPILSIGNQYGEGWFLAGEMVELIKSGVPNIVCIQPFACLPNHVVGKGVIKILREMYPESNVVAVDYDPGASEVNQLNRIKLMLSIAKENLKNSEQ